MYVQVTSSADVWELYADLHFSSTERLDHDKVHILFLSQSLSLFSSVCVCVCVFRDCLSYRRPSGVHGRSGAGIGSGPA